MSGTLENCERVMFVGLYGFDGPHVVDIMRYSFTRFGCSDFMPSCIHVVDVDGLMLMEMMETLY